MNNLRVGYPRGVIRRTYFLRVLVLLNFVFVFSGLLLVWQKFQVVQKGYLINGLRDNLSSFKRENIGLKAYLSSIQAPHCLEKLMDDRKICLESPTFKQILYVHKKDDVGDVTQGH